MAFDNIDQKLLKEHLHVLLFNLHEAVLVEDQNRKVLFCNINFCEVFQIPVPPEALIGMDCGLMAEESKNTIVNPEYFILRVQQILKDKVKVIGEEIELLSGIKLTRDYIPIFIDNKYFGHMWKYRDTTENYILIKKLRELNDFKVRLLSLISHDLKAPFSRLNGIFKLMELNALTDAEFKDNFQKIRRDFTQAQGLMENLLQWTYSQIHGEVQSISSFSINELLREKYLQFIQVALDKKINLIFYDTEELYVRADINQVKVVLRNLISNAIKFTPSLKSIYFSLSVEGDFVNIIVKDEGIGIPDNLRTELFKIGGKSRKGTQNESGLGLGLGMCKEYVEKNGGTIQLLPKEEFGTSFIVSLPRTFAVDL